MNMSTKMIAHRGLSGMETENTLAAFEAACKRLFYGIETDVHVTKDGKYIIFHDECTGRLCEKNLIIEETDFEILRSLKFKDGISEMPMLSEYLQVISRYKKVAVIELKKSMRESNIEEIIEICKQEYTLDKIIFISFDFENLVAVRKLLPKQKIQFLTEKFGDGLIKSLKEYGFDLDIRYDLLTKEKIKELHENDITINCWTCDDRQKAEELIGFEVDFITTNILD